jgi:CheY-like chemotaxis protein
VRSEGSNLGSEFTVRLPVASESHKPRAEQTSAQPQPSRRHRVLVVDDNRDSAQLLGLVLKVLGNEVCLAHDGTEAIKAAEEFLPSVILMDLGMPKMNGFDAARFIRQQRWGERMVLVALTGWGQEEDKLRTQDAGFNFHLTKPAEPAAIQRLLETLAVSR